MKGYWKLAAAGAISTVLTGQVMAQQGGAKAGTNTGGANTAGAGATQGTAGTQGTAPSQGTAGAQGTTATQGTPATQGTAAAQGTTGAKGITGTQSTTGQMGMGMNQTPWFSNSEIRTHLNLNDQQFKQLNEAYGQGYSSYNTNLNQLGNNLTPEERNQRIQDLHSTIDRKFNQAVQSSITDPTHLKRFNQLNMQYQGYNAFNDPQVQQKLNLTADQRKQINQYNQQYNQQLTALQKNSNPQAASQQFTTMRQKANENINTVLTPQQQQMWQGMVGQPYNFQWSDYHNTQTGFRPVGTTQQPGTTQQQNNGVQQNR